MTADKSCATCAYANSDMICVNLESDKCGQAVCGRDSCEEWKGEEMSEINEAIEHAKLCVQCEIEDIECKNCLRKDSEKCPLKNYPNHGDFAWFYKLILQALQEKLDHENPKPLTLEQLREMDGQPVYVVSCEQLKPFKSYWGIVNLHNEMVLDVWDGAIELSEYGKTWLAYARPPKEQTP